MDITINIPNRAGVFGGVTRYPVARVRLRLELDGSPSGATWTYDENNDDDFEVDLYPFGAIPVVNTPDGDEVIIREGTDYLEIDMTLNSDFVSVGGTPDFTTIDPAVTVPYTMDMVFTPPAGVNVLDYRFSSYSIPSSFNSSCPRRRLDNNAPTVTLSPPPAGSGKRHPIDVLLVLDRSGSMGGSVPTGLPGAGMSKMDALKDATTQFIDVWRTEATGDDQDRLGLIWFSTSATIEGFGSPVVQLVPRGTDWDTVKSEINAENPSGSTALGNGLTQAYFLQEDVSIQNPDTMILLLSDGMQNTGDEIILDEPATADPPDDPLLHTFRDENESASAGSPVWLDLADKCLTIQSVGLGATGSGATAWEELLKFISEETGGRVDLTWPSSLAAAYINQLIEVMKGNTLSQVFHADDTLAAGQSSVDTFNFPIDGSVQQFIVTLNWRKPNAISSSLRLELFDPSGDPIRPDTREDESFHTVYGVNMADRVAGSYSATVRHLESDNQAVEYTISVLVTEGNLSHRLHFPDKHIATGEPIDLGLEVSWDGKPVSNAKATVRIEAPPGALGTFLHENEVSDEILKHNPGNDITAQDQFGAVSSRKIWHLLNEGKLKEIILPSATEPIPMKQVEPGIYNLSFTDTKVPGTYRFLVELEVESDTGVVRRIEERQAVVTIETIDADSSEITLSQVNDSIYFMTMVLRDQFGNVVAPDHQQSFILQVGDQKVAVQTSPSADGRYQARFRASSSTPVSLNYRGGEKPIVSSSVAELIRPGDDKPDDHFPDDIHDIIEDLPEGCRNILRLILRLIKSILKK